MGEGHLPLRHVPTPLAPGVARTLHAAVEGLELSRALARIHESRRQEGASGGVGAELEDAEKGIEIETRRRVDQAVRGRMYSWRKVAPLQRRPEAVEEGFVEEGTVGAAVCLKGQACSRRRGGIDLVQELCTLF